MTYQGNLLSKTLIIGIILLFVVMSIIPSIAVDIVKIENVIGKNSGNDVDWWPMFRHDPQHSGYSTSKAPDTNNVLWSYKIGERVSSPAVVDGRVYIGSWDDWVYCLDAITGDWIWFYPTGDSVDSSPAVADGKVYIGSDDYNMYCLDAITGDYIWSYTIDGYVDNSPVIADGKIYFGSNDYDSEFGIVYCLDANTGENIWKRKTRYWDWVTSSCAVADDKVYFGTSPPNAQPEAKVYCFDADTGDYIWSYKTEDWGTSSPAVADGKVYFGTYQPLYHDDGDVYCLDAITGDVIWGYSNIGQGASSSPAVADGKVYIGSLDKNVYCLEANTGKHIWRYTTEYKVYSSPAVADGKVYISPYLDWMYCLDANTGKHIWSYNIGHGTYSSPAVADGKVYIGSHDGNVYAFGELDPDAPYAPEIIGPARGMPDVLYNFTFKAESPVGNDLFYWIEWADGSNSGWVGPYGSGVEITESHVWDEKGKCRIQAKAKDINGLVSSWSFFKFRISRNRAIVNSLFQLFFDRFPLLEVFLREMNLLR